MRGNKGSAGVDKETLKKFEENLKNNLYKLWNRMSSGSYFPSSVKTVAIPKKAGGERLLGIPTVGDRICQMVVKLLLEPKVEESFLPDSYGYRPGKSAIDGIGKTRQRCWRYDWIVEYDIEGLFDNIPHELLLKAVSKYTKEKWILLYVKRWLEAPIQWQDGRVTKRRQGTPQGGVISPILSNIFLHNVNDKWMQKKYPQTPWCRYADDGLIHCKTLEEAEHILEAIRKRFGDCGLQLHRKKTKIVYCKDDNRQGEYKNTTFDFLGYTFKARGSKRSKDNKIFRNFTPGVSKEAKKAMCGSTRESEIRNRTDLSLEDIARWYNPKLQGWLNYYGKYNRSSLYPVWRHFNKTLVSWAMRKYRRLRHRKTRAAKFLERIAEENSKLFVHWRNGMKGAFA